MSAPRSRPTLFTIPPHVPFVDALAQGLWAQSGGDPLALSRAIVLLPTRRAGRALREAFLRLGNGQATLLPRMAAIADVDGETLEIGAGAIPGLADHLDLPPAISPLRRRLLLTRLVLAGRSTLSDGKGMGFDQAARLANDLATLLDEVHTERLSFEKLADLAPADFATHWQITLDFLKLVTEAWPKVLAEEGVLDPADRRNRLLDAQAAAWRARPPEGPVIAAGLTGTVPAVADLIEVIAQLPQGMVVLPGLDQQLDDAAWTALDESHPQYGLAQLLERLKITRQDVALFQGEKDTASPRLRLLTEAMRPASVSDAWSELADISEIALDGLSRVDAPGSHEEAQAIALMMRADLEHPEHTVALVTPDRSLARRVATALARWGVQADDSAGRPLSGTAAGTFLHLLATCAQEELAPISLLALLKHPLAAAGYKPAHFRATVRVLERYVLRGPRPSPGFAGLRAAVQSSASDEHREALLELVETLETRLGAFVDMLSAPHTLAKLLRAHIHAAEALTVTPEDTGANRLWRHEDGEALANLMADLLDAAKDFPDMPGPEYPALFETLLKGQVVRPRYGLHPRAFILGPLEARLQHFDHIILGGLNEGTWPATAASDPWMSRPMRKAFGLPSPEQRIGAAAHDVLLAACALNVTLTRAARVEGAPTVPSRWLLRLDTVLRGARLEGRIDRNAAQWLAWAAALDQPERVQPVAAPAPRPAVEARPRRLSVTEIETWMRDPYALYARHVLRLKKLDTLAQDPGASERGQFIHQALDRFVQAHPRNLPLDAYEILLEFGREAFGDTLAQPDVWAFWWPRFERIAAWFIGWEQERRKTIQPLATEVSGQMALDGPAGPFTLTAKADRIDRLPDGGVAIIDYKTGSLPKLKDIPLGYAPQLSLEAAIAAVGGFPGVPAASASDLTYVRLTGNDPPAEVTPLKDVAELVEGAEDGLLNLIALYDDPSTPYLSQPRPRHTPRYTDYAHLARVAEWSVGGSEGEE